LTACHCPSPAPSPSFAGGRSLLLAPPTFGDSSVRPTSSSESLAAVISHSSSSRCAVPFCAAWPGPGGGDLAAALGAGTGQYSVQLWKRSEALGQSGFTARSAPASSSESSAAAGTTRLAPSPCLVPFCAGRGRGGDGLGAAALGAGTGQYSAQRWKGLAALGQSGLTPPPASIAGGRALSPPPPPPPPGSAAGRASKPDRREVQVDSQARENPQRLEHPMGWRRATHGRRRRIGAEGKGSEREIRGACWRREVGEASRGNGRGPSSKS